MQGILDALKLNTETLIVLGPVVAVMIIMIVYIVWQKRKIAKLEYSLTPKYGFLGKPLYSTLAAFVMMSAFGLTFLATQQSGNVQDVSATKKIEILLQYKVVGPQPGGYLVEFVVIPQVNSVPWGVNGQESFDVFWNVKGPVEETKAELGRTISKPSKYSVILPVGNYEVKVSVFGTDKDNSKQINIRVP
jgi:hypothetical protein